jgi:hypothetical protein
MLEDAMSQVLRLNVREMNSYVIWERYSLFKLHGSIDWGRVVEGIYDRDGRPSGEYQQLIDSVTQDSDCVTERYRLCDRELRSQSDATEALYPALSIPVEHKDEFSCPREHVTALEAALSGVRKVITIGWRATEAEFLKKVQSRSPRPDRKLLVVSGSKEGAEETLRNLALYKVISDPLLDLDRMATNGFTGLINNLGMLTGFLHHGPR